ncbi:MAG: sigma-54 dependent transcriptional regulator [bacterium]
MSAEAHPVRLDAWNQRYANMVGESARLHQVFRLIDRVAKSDATVLIYGESGTGKELVAEALHHNSDRSRGPFVKVNCAAFVENLLLSELFGHEKGAFTGASSQKPGRFELADGGTIFLDEIGDVSPNTQVALLRVLQEGTFERVGGSTTQQVDVRVVCATNRNLEEMVQRGEFRLDLYYRLKGVVIESPALRERREDIPRLLEHFAQKFADGVPKHFSPVVMKHLMRYSWPGNIRELQNFVRSILLFVEGHEVTMADLDDFQDFFISGEFEDISVELPDLAPRPTFAPAATQTDMGRDPEDVLVDKIVNQGMCLNELKKRLEVEAIKRALLEADGNVTKAAEMLQMKRPRLSQIINGTEELADLKALLVG